MAAVHVPFLAVLAGKGPSSVTGGHSDGHDDDDDREHDNPDCNKKQATCPCHMSFHIIIVVTEPTAAAVAAAVAAAGVVVVADSRRCWWVVVMVMVVLVYYGDSDCASATRGQLFVQTGGSLPSQSLAQEQI